MLQIIFGDDEHTAEEGPYARLMKTRKWLYLSALALAGVELGLYDAQAAKELVRVVVLPAPIVSHALAVGVAYLLAQYILLSGQLLSTYDIVLADRFKFRRADELSAAGKRFKEAAEEHRRAQAQASGNRASAIEKRRADAAESAEVARHALRVATAARRSIEQSTVVDPQDLRIVLHEENRARATNAVAKRALDRASSEAVVLDLQLSDDPTVAATQAVLDDTKATLDTLRAEVPSERRGYAVLERLIDAARLLPPFLLALATLVAFVRA